jgi:hypothetical protein
MGDFLPIRRAAGERAGGPRGGDPAARSAQWVANDALRELTSEKVRARLRAAAPNARGRAALTKRR